MSAPDRPEVECRRARHEAPSVSATARYAAYWAPEREHPLWNAGCEWLSRDPERAGVYAPLRPFTDNPRRYGFHATLKAPMTLRDGAGPREVVDLLEKLAARADRFLMPALEVATLRGFVALRPASAIGPDHPLRRLADACVCELDPIRGLPRVPGPYRFGYPYVFDRWQFHMTLSDRFEDDALSNRARDQLLDEAGRHFAEALALPLPCNSICVFTEPQAGAPFLLSHRIALAE